MKQTAPGYSIPYAPSRGLGILFMAVTLFLMGRCVWELLPDLQAGSLEAFVLLIPLVLFVLPLFHGLLCIFGCLHLVPQGIAVTLFGKTLRRYPVERIGLLCGTIRRHKHSRSPMLGVCLYTLEELAGKGEQQLAAKPYYRSSIPHMKRRSGWMERFAGEYLRHRCNSMFKLPLSKDILWLDWDVQRLTLLRQMYPNAAWLDTTEKKEFDVQLTDTVDP